MWDIIYRNPSPQKVHHHTHLDPTYDQKLDTIFCWGGGGGLNNKPVFNLCMINVLWLLFYGFIFTFVFNVSIESLMTQDKQ